MSDATPHLDVFTDPLTPVTLLQRSARVFPKRRAVVYGDALVWDYRRLAEEVGRMAGALRRAGVVPGDRVAILAPNTPLHLVAHFAMPLLRAPLVSINTRLAGAEIAHILAHSGAKVLLVDPELAPRLDGSRESLSELELVVEMPDPKAPLRPGQTSYETFVAGAEVLPLVNAVEDELEVLSINYTSGTTGTPKGVMYTHRGGTLNALTQIGTAKLKKESAFLWTLPMFHCNGWCMPWAVTAAGATHVCLRGADPAEILSTLKTRGVTHLNGAPTLLLMIASHPDAAGLRVEPPLLVCTGGAPPSPTLLTRMEEIGFQISHLYGLTETYGPHVLCEMQTEWESLPVEERAKVMSRQGVPYVHSVYLRVVDSEMNDVPADGQTTGEVVMRGNNVMRGYYRDPEATTKAFEGGWFHSGDVAVMHADGYLELRDRSKDIIVSGGENISSIEVEHCLVKHPAVMECAIVAMPHEKWGEVPKAFVALKPGQEVSEADLIAFARERLAHFKCPKAVQFGELPKTATGKIQKFKLREPLWAGHEKRIQ